jgi:hypothetical protein
MIGLGLGLLLLSILFGGPALVAVGRHQLARQRAAAKARRQAAEERRQRALDAQHRVELIWRNSPDRAGVGEYLRYLSVRTPLDQAASEAQRRLGQRSDQVDHVLARYPGGRHPSTRYRLVVLAGFAFFLGAFALGITLDYLIFRGLHPTGTMLLPFALACLEPRPRQAGRVGRGRGPHLWRRRALPGGGGDRLPSPPPAADGNAGRGPWGSIDATASHDRDPRPACAGRMDAAASAAGPHAGPAAASRQRPAEAPRRGVPSCQQPPLRASPATAWRLPARPASRGALDALRSTGPSVCPARRPGSSGQPARPGPARVRDNE